MFCLTLFLALWEMEKGQKQNQTEKNNTACQTDCVSSLRVWQDEVMPKKLDQVSDSQAGFTL